MDKTDVTSDGNDKPIQQIEVKSELNKDTIKNYAEHTMNELLGLFGYNDKINSTDTENLNLENYSDTKDAVTDLICKNHLMDKSRSADSLKSDLIRRMAPRVDNAFSKQHSAIMSALKRKETKERHGPYTSSNRECLPEHCAWCKTPGNKQIAVETTKGTKFFCSEICFTQCRRASFKKNKVCDWCKQTRLTSNVLEFQDGEILLQFCGEKCLNQYKMSVFCKETQMHLQKMMASGDDSLSGKEDQGILITPELWMRGEQAKHAAEARRSARDRDNRNRGKFRKSQTLSLDKDRNLKPLQTKPQTKNIADDVLENYRHERNLKSKRELNAKKSEHASPPSRSGIDTNMSTSSSCSAISPQLLHSAMVAMGPWLQQAQYMGSISPGTVQCGPFPPMMLSGLFPHLYAGTIAKTKNVACERDHDTIVNKPLKDDRQSISNHVLGSGFDNSNNVSQVNDRKPSPTLADRRTSILFPVDFPDFFATRQMQNNQSKPTTSVGASVPQSGIAAAVPPITMMVPFPVILPLPVPVPIPIPLTVQQLKTFFGYATENSCTSVKAPMSPTNIEKPNVSKSPLPICDQNRLSAAPSPNDISNDLSAVRSGSRNSCPDLSQSSINRYINYDDRVSNNKERFNYKRSRTPDMIKSLDLSMSSKYARCDLNAVTSDSNDGVIDLSASRDNGHKSNDNMSENGCITGQMTDDNNSSRDNSDACSDDLPAIPKIHIITHKEETPLNQPLPLPPTEHPYSSRRGLILDAPAIRKRSKSPSPERHIYVRNVPRDIIEAAKRRCIRAKIQTK